MMGREGQHAADFGGREVAAARRVIAEFWSGLRSFRDAMVLVGGWVPELLLPAARPPHTGSIDVDVLLDPAVLDGARIKQLADELRTRSYEPTAERFRFKKKIDLEDGGPPVHVSVDFLAPAGGAPEEEDTALGRFRAFEVDGARPVLSSRAVVAWRGAAESDEGETAEVVTPTAAAFLVMKAFALRSRVKPKDVYDVVFMLKNWPGGPQIIAAQLGRGPVQGDVKEALRVLAVWFASPNHLGPQAYAGFFEPADRDAAAVLARDAFERVQALLRELGFEENARP